MGQQLIWNKLYKGNLTWKKEAIDLPNIIKDKNVLELGVGTGKTLQSILRQNPKSITAVDFSEEAIKKSSELFKSDKISFKKADLLNLPFKEKFDIIVCYYVLNNLKNEERKKAIIQMYKALKKDGIILFEDLAEGDFREKKDSRLIEPHTIRKENGIICHFFAEGELISLFDKFLKIKSSLKVSAPIKSHPELKRKIIRAIIKK